MIKRTSQKQRGSTLRVNVGQARHFTFDFVNDVFTSVTNIHSATEGDNTNKHELGVAATEESAESTVM